MDTLDGNLEFLRIDDAVVLVSYLLRCDTPVVLACITLINIKYYYCTPTTSQGKGLTLQRNHHELDRVCSISGISHPKSNHPHSFKKSLNRAGTTVRNSGPHLPSYARS